MRNNCHVPEFSFPSVTYGKYESPWDLKVLLYLGGGKANPRHVTDLINSGRLGTPLLERLELIQKIHEAIHSKLVGGGSHRSACTSVELIRRFFTWAEQANHPLTLDTIQTTYLHWTDWLVHRHRVVGDLKANAAYLWTHLSLTASTLQVAYGVSTTAISIVKIMCGRLDVFATSSSSS